MAIKTISDINTSRMLPDLKHHLEAIFKAAVVEELIDEMPAFALVVCSTRADGSSSYIANCSNQDFKQIISKLNERLQSGSPHVCLHEAH